MTWCAATSATARWSQPAADAPAAAVVNFAAESHVDRSIDGPGGLRRDQSSSAPSRCSTRSRPTGARSKATRATRSASCTSRPTRSTARSAPTIRRSPRRRRTRPTARTRPRRPARDHLVRAYHHTYGLPVLTTNCSNNYGPFQFPEKLIPLIIHQRARRQAAAGLRRRQERARLALRRGPLLGDRPRARRGPAGETYNVGGNSERQNIDVVHTLCDILDELRPVAPPAATRT